MIESGPFKAIIVRNDRVVAAFRVDLTVSEASRHFLRSHLATVESEKALILDDPEAHYWEILGSQKCFTFTAADRLSLGWFQQYAKDMDVLSLWLDDLRTRIGNEMLASLEKRPYPTELKSLLRIILEFRFQGSAVHSELTARYADNAGSVWATLRDWLTVEESGAAEPEEWRELLELIVCVLEGYAHGSRMTRCGRLLPYYDYRENTCRKMELKPRDFPQSCEPENYWSRVPNHIPFGWGNLIDASDFPFDPKSWTERIERLPAADDVEEALAAGYNLLDEARENRTGTIPPRAMVELAIGPFIGFEITERSNEIDFVFWTGDGCFATGSIESGKRKHSFPIPERIEGIDEGLKIRIDAGMFLLLCAVVRDFCVVENREHVFDHRLDQSRTPRKPTNNEEPRVVYLPRVKYRNRPNVKDCNSQLSLEEKSLHSVRAHLRRVANASEHQFVLARRYGVDIPEGYTFVSPHKRGKKKRDVIYRSRSATSMPVHCGIQCRNAAACAMVSVRTGRSRPDESSRLSR